MSRFIHVQLSTPATHAQALAHTAPLVRGDDAPGVLTVEVDLARVETARAAVPALGLARAFARP